MGKTKEYDIVPFSVEERLFLSEHDPYLFTQAFLKELKQSIDPKIVEARCKKGEEIRKISDPFKDPVARVMQGYHTTFIEAVLLLSLWHKLTPDYIEE